MPRAMLRAASCVLLFAATAVFHHPALARTVRVHLFNLNAGHAYPAQHNGSQIAAPVASQAGSLALGVEASPGDAIRFVDDGGTNLQPPTPPVFSSLETGGAGCATASWLPSGDPTVVGYVVSYGRSPSLYEQSVTVGAVSSHEVCSLAQGMHYFAVQARNYAGMVSAYSSERSVEIVVVSVLFADFEARVVPDGVALSWSVVSDERIAGYRVYRSGPDGIERPVTTELLPASQNNMVDGAVRPATRYTYAVAAVNEAGEETRSYTVPVSVPALTLSLGQNVPNPFNPMTVIPFVLESASRVIIRIYDVRGAHVATLHDGVLPEGRHTVAWDGRNDGGREVSSGTYLCALSAGKQLLSRKMMLVR